MILSKKPGWIAIALTSVVLASSAHAAWPVRFSDGTVAEVIGITENGDAAGGRWWAVDGSEAPDPQFQSTGSVSGGQSGAKSLQLIVKPGGSDMKGKNLVVRAGPDFQEGLFKMNDARGEMIQVFAPAPADKPTFALRFGLASGAATDTVLWQRDGVATTQPAQTPLKFVAIEEDHGQTLVRFKSDQPARRGPAGRRMMAGGAMGGAPVGGGGGGNAGQIRGKGGMGGPMIFELLFGDSLQDQKVTVQAHGQKLTPIGFEGSGDGSLTMRFRCPKDQVEKVVLSSRGFEWIEMQNVSTQPSATATKVKVVPVKDLPIKETTPSTGTPPPRG